MAVVGAVISSVGVVATGRPQSRETTVMGLRIVRLGFLTTLVPWDTLVLDWVVSGRYAWVELLPVSPRRWLRKSLASASRVRSRSSIADRSPHGYSADTFTKPFH